MPLPTQKGFVFIVDDHSDNRQLATDILQSQGYQPFIGASNGNEAWLALQALVTSGAELPEVLLVDNDMHLADGRSLISAIRADDNLRHLPIVQWGTKDVTTAEREAAGVDAVVRKGSLPGALVTAVREAVVNRQAITPDTGWENVKRTKDNLPTQGDL